MGEFSQTSQSPRHCRKALRPPRVWLDAKRGGLFAARLSEAPMMTRCHRTEDLGVRHKSRKGGNGIDNAQVLCPECQAVATANYGNPGEGPPPFDEATRAKALAKAGNRCECLSPGGCH
jgi:hypothetical protein